MAAHSEAAFGWYIRYNAKQAELAQKITAFSPCNFSGYSDAVSIMGNIILFLNKTI
jgi:hypothetical protein